ncbi:hypothetical protein TNCV_3290521 [Trichonephila clavipes]|nr:hypothetical protein TNCV_3290521 [Trichonephila clavipes]
MVTAELHYECITQFPDRRMPDHRIFQWLRCQLRKTRSFHVTRYDSGRRRATKNSEEDCDDVQELLDSHHQELTMDELKEIHQYELDIEELES